MIVLIAMSGLFFDNLFCEKIQHQLIHGCKKKANLNFKLETMIKSLVTTAFFLGSILFLSSSFQLKKKELNPTGTYEYDHGQNGNGKVKVQKLSQNQIKVSIFVVGGEPSHNTGEFMKVIKINNGVSTYHSGDCGLKFVFSSNAVRVTQTDWNCEFGAGVSADGLYKKTSSKVPNMDEAY
jgi:hypothetical protein